MVKAYLRRIFVFALKKVLVLSPCFISCAILIETRNSKSLENFEYWTNWTISWLIHNFFLLGSASLFRQCVTGLLESNINIPQRIPSAW